MEIIPKLTIGTVVHDDYDGLYFSIQAIRMYHPEIIDQVEFIIIDNNPNSKSGVESKMFSQQVRYSMEYIPFDGYKSTAIRDFVFKRAKTEFVLCMDCHVFFHPGSLKKLLDFFVAGKDEGNLLQGPLVYDNLVSISTHFKPVWRDKMWGIWETDERGKTLDGDPFEIPMQGLGVFACRKDTWPGFNPHFHGFGGEEGYIHEKMRQRGKKTLCLPFLRWMHRFGRPNGVSYPLKAEDRIINYYLGHHELGMDCQPITDHFKEWYREEDLARMMDFAIQQNLSL